MSGKANDGNARVLSSEYGIVPAACGARLSKVLGFGELVVGGVRSIPPLVVVADSDPQFPNHALITGIPYVDLETATLEQICLKEDFATALSLQSTLILREKQPD